MTIYSDIVIFILTLRPIVALSMQTDRQAKSARNELEEGVALSHPYLWHECNEDAPYFVYSPLVE